MYIKQSHWRNDKFLMRALSPDFLLRFSGCQSGRTRFLYGKHVPSKKLGQKTCLKSKDFRRNSAQVHKANLDEIGSRKGQWHALQKPTLETSPHSSRACELMTPPPFDAALVTPAAVLEAYQRLPLGRFAL